VGLRARARGSPCTGVVFKIEDGSARARDAVTLALLDRLGELPAEARRSLASYAEPVVHNARGVDVGRIEAEAPLTRSGARARLRRAAAIR
jgi:L-asparaginase II